MQKVRKAVILAAGLGTRMLPATKSVPKELFPIVDKPALQYLVEELADSGIESIMIVISRGKTLIEDHFDRSPELERHLEADHKDAYLEMVRKISSKAEIVYTRQQEMKGTGHALLSARSFTGNEPFAVLYGDDVIINEQNPVTGQLIKAWNEYGLGIAGVQEVSEEAIQKYSSMKVEPIKDNLYTVSDMIEKPKPEEMFSNFSILGRMVLPPKIFDILETIPRGAGNEYQLTDAMKILARQEGMIGVDFTGTRYDMGNKFGILKASIEVALNHPEIKDETKEYIKELAKTL